jgi:HD-like signal output (HDOD) protein
MPAIGNAVSPGTVASAADLVAPVVELLHRNALRVPPYPAVAVRLRRVVAQGTYGISDLERIVAEDSSLVATLLRYANSAAYRRVTPTTTLNAAIMRVGATEVARIAMSLSMNAFASRGGTLASVRQAAWQQALISGLACRALAYWRKTDAEEAYVCGLLHDFGRIVAVSGFEDVLSRSHDERVLPAEEWGRAVEDIHVVFGLATAKMWNLSPLLCAVIAHHHEPEAAGEFRNMCEVVAASDALVSLLCASAYPTAEQIVATQHFRPEEAEYIVTLLPTIAAALSAVDETAASEEVDPRAKSQVAKPPTTLPGPHKAFTFSAHILRATGNMSCQGTYLGRDGLAFLSKSKLRDNSMVRLSVEIAREKLELWGVVTLCEPEGSEFHVETKLFATPPELQQAWSRLFASVG